MTFSRDIGGAAIVLGMLCSGATARPLALHAQQLHVLKITSGPAGSEVNGTFVLSEERASFSRLDDKEVIVYFMWISLRMYDAENRMVIQGKPAKRDLRKSTLVMSSWQLAMPSAAGLYRADVLLDEKVMWRSYVRVTP